jgi:DNA-binding transcriptional LysR family regulator
LLPSSSCRGRPNPRCIGGAGITEQGLRNRLLTLEQRLGVELYRKSRGARRSAVLTDQGRRFLPHAIGFLERAQELCRTVDVEAGPQEIRVASSQYLIRYLLIDVLKDFRKAAPEIHVRISTMNELEVEEALRNDPEVAMGLAAPYEPSPDFDYHELFAMSWSLITPVQHPLSRKRRTRLQDLAAQPLIMYERGSTGRQHVLECIPRERRVAARGARNHEHGNDCEHGGGGVGDCHRTAAAERRSDARPPRRNMPARRAHSPHPLGRTRETRRKTLRGFIVAVRFHQTAFFAVTAA